MTTMTHSQGARTGLWQCITRMADIPGTLAPCCHWYAAGGLVLGIYRWYQQTHSFTVSFDYFEQDFQIYWMRLLYTR